MFLSGMNSVTIYLLFDFMPTSMLSRKNNNNKIYKLTLYSAKDIRYSNNYIFTLKSYPAGVPLHSKMRSRHFKNN